MLAVADTGIGIPEDAKELVFEEFRQVDSSSMDHHARQTVKPATWIVSPGVL